MGLGLFGEDVQRDAVAAQDGLYDVVQVLLDAGADLNIRDYTGRTAIDRARNGRDPELLRMLERVAGAR